MVLTCTGDVGRGAAHRKRSLKRPIERISQDATPHLSSMARPTVASSSANWSPTHLRMPPPKGMKAKSAATSLGYSELPCASGLRAQPRPFHQHERAPGDVLLETLHQMLV